MVFLCPIRTGDDVSPNDGGEAVRDHDGGAADHEIVERFLHDALARVVQRARGLPGDGNPSPIQV